MNENLEKMNKIEKSNQISTGRPATWQGYFYIPDSKLAPFQVHQLFHSAFDTDKRGTPMLTDSPDCSMMWIIYMEKINVCLFMYLDEWRVILNIIKKFKRVIMLIGVFIEYKKMFIWEVLLAITGSKMKFFLKGDV